MFAKILGIAAVSAVLATGALAQTSTTPDAGTAANNAEAEKAMLEAWKGPIGLAFFTDDTMGTMKSEADMKAGWTALTPEQQAQVKADCDKTAADEDGNLSNVETICAMVKGS